MGHIILIGALDDKDTYADIGRGDRKLRSFPQTCTCLPQPSRDRQNY
jgi:hypothetical protein